MLIVDFCNFANVPKNPLHENLKTNADISVARHFSYLPVLRQVVYKNFPYLPTSRWGI